MQISVVIQDPSLLHRSIRDNIRYGRPDATEAQIVAAAQRAPALGFIAELEDFRDGAASTPKWASAASSCAVASANAVRLPASFSRTRPSSCSTRRLPRSTARSKQRSRQAWAR